jgi:hypothetical protein
VNNTYPPGQREPLNLIISGNSDDRVLKEQEKHGGLLNYFLSLEFSTECLGQRSESLQKANLGDGNGYGRTLLNIYSTVFLIIYLVPSTVNETAIIRYNYGDAQLGACKETIQGGNHFRYWIQNGPQGNSGAIFMAASYELPLAAGHDIVPNGYNLARDWIIGNITKTDIANSNLTSESTCSGSTSYANYTYTTSVTYVSDLLPNTSIGINHNLTVGVNNILAVDGLVAVLNVQITGTPPKSFASRHSPPHLWQLSLLLIVFVMTMLLPAPIVL